MVEVAVGGVGEFECAEADVVQRLVIDAERLIGVLNELMHRQSGVVWLHHSVRHLHDSRTFITLPFMYTP